jgi:lipopolysaccharide transport system permease protein
MSNQFAILVQRYIELVVYKTYADLRTETEKTYIGFLWWVFDPIMYMFIFYFVFGVLLNRGTENYVAFLLVGLVVWRWFHNTVTHGSTTIMEGKVLMRQVYIPKIIFPTVVVFTDFVKFLFVFFLLLSYLWIDGFRFGSALFYLPLVLIVQFLFNIALTWLTASAVPFFPDLRILIDNLFQALFFLSGIFFSGSSLTDDHQLYFYINPMANLIESYRDVLMYNQAPDYTTLMVIGVLSMLIAIVAYRVFKRYDYIYPKLVS